MCTEQLLFLACYLHLGGGCFPSWTERLLSTRKDFFSCVLDSEVLRKIASPSRGGASKVKGCEFFWAACHFAWKTLEMLRKQLT